MIRSDPENPGSQASVMTTHETSPLVSVRDLILAGLGAFVFLATILFLSNRDVVLDVQTYAMRIAELPHHESYDEDGLVVRGETIEPTVGLLSDFNLTSKPDLERKIRIYVNPRNNIY